MLQNEEYIKLVAPVLGVREFTKEHAECIMSLPDHKRGGWEYYEGDKDDDKKLSNAVINPGNKGNSKGKKRERETSTE